MMGFFKRIRIYLRFFAMPWGQRWLLDRLSTLRPWLRPPILLMPLVLLPSTITPNPLLWVSILLLLMASFGLIDLGRVWGYKLVDRTPLLPFIMILGVLPLGLLFSYMGILTEPYFYNTKKLNRTLRGYNHISFKVPKGIRTDPVPAGLLLGCLLLGITPRQLRTYPIGILDRYHPENWDIAHWENVEVLGDDHNDAATEFYLDRASAAIKITFTFPVLDYYLERLIQWDEGVYWWFADRPPPFYSQKPFRSNCWGGLLRQAPKDLYFLDTGRPPQYHQSGGYHPLWIARQASLLLAKETPPNYRGAPRLAPWVLGGGQPAWTRVSGAQRQQRLQELLETNEYYRERTHEMLAYFRSRETVMSAMQRYLYHPDAQEERDHRHMRIREHIEEGEAQDRLVEATIAHDDAMATELWELDFEEFEEDLEEFMEKVLETKACSEVEGLAAPRMYSLFDLKIFVPYDVPARD
jgi:hypothetical protein